MKIITVVSLALLFALTNCNNQNGVSASISIDSIAKMYYDERAVLYPVDATGIGDFRYNDSWPNDLSQQVINERKIFYQKFAGLLKHAKTKSLSDGDKITYDILQWDCSINLEGLQFKEYLLPLNQYISNHLFIPQLVDGTGIQPLVSVKDYDNWLKRLEGYITWLDTARANMATGIKEGYVLPKTLIEKMIPQFEMFDHGKPEEHFFYTTIKNMPDSLPAADKKRLSGKYRKVIAEKLIPSYAAMTAFLKKEYLPAGRQSAGITQTPLGNEYYAWLIKYYTTTNLTAEEIYNTGLKEVARIRTEMEAIKNEVGFKGNLPEFFEFVKNNKVLMPYKTQQQVLAHFDTIQQRMKPFLKKMFLTEPKSKLEIKRVPAYLEGPNAAAYYNIGSPDGTRPGIFYVPIPDAKTYNIFRDEVLFIHEGIPGHHYQGSFQNEDTTMPKIRLILSNYLGYVEGWGLYTESLGKELGLYKDPYQYLGRLTLEMHRALRLVIDVGLHAKGWSKAQAIKYSLENEPQTEQVITAEVERYMAWPGQALAYKIGELKIKELRKKAEEKLGDKFSLAAFHQQILETGAAPLQVLENKINKWIESY
jgi:uncharacterized protein (DUF885 family)